MPGGGGWIKVLTKKRDDGHIKRGSVLSIVHRLPSRAQGLQTQSEPGPGFPSDQAENTFNKWEFQVRVLFVGHFIKNMSVFGLTAHLTAGINDVPGDHESLTRT